MNIILAMMTAFFWGTTYAVTQYSLSGWPPLLLGAIRALPAGLLLLAIKPNLPTKAHWGVLLRLGTINIALFFSLIFVMALTLPSAISGVGMISVPVFAMVYHWLFYKKRPTLVQIIPGLTLIGLAWLLFDPNAITLNPLGLMAMLAAISCIVVGSNMTRSLGSNLHWWTVLSWQLVIGGSLLAVAALIQAALDPAPYVHVIENFNRGNALGLLWLVLLNTAISYTLYVWLLRRMTVVEFTFGGIANPLAGILSGMLLLHETFTPYQYSLMLGMILTSLLPPLLGLLSEKKRLRH